MPRKKGEPFTVPITRSIDTPIAFGASLLKPAHPAAMVSGIAFPEWFGDNRACIETVDGLLCEPLSDEPAVLARQLASIEAWFGRLTKLLSDANAFLDRAQYVALMRMPDDMTTREREIRINDIVCDERRTRNQLQGLVDAVKNRTILGMALAKAQRGEKADWA